jgi:hypothetical protein
MFDRWLEWTPPSLCHLDFGATEIALASAALAAPEGGLLAAVPAVTTAALSPAAVAGAGAGILGTGLTLGDVGAIAGAGGTLLSAKSGLDQADYQAAVQRANAQALKDQANTDAAAAERAQITRNRQTQLVQSRAQALAAGSGTDATSPDVLNTEQQIAGQGTYNALSALYEGQSRARSDQYQSQIDLYNANRIESAAPLTAGGTLLSGISNFAQNRVRLKSYTLGGGYTGF